MTRLADVAVGVLAALLAVALVALFMVLAYRLGAASCVGAV